MYRNEKFRKGAENAPCFMRGPNCTGGGAGRGDVCLRHSNEMIHGKATGQKSHDLFGFYGCQSCEDWYAGALSREIKIEVRRPANEETLIYACNHGILVGD